VSEKVAWRVELLRLSVLGNITGPFPPSIFADLFGADPDFSGEKPKEGTRMDQGQWKGQSVVVQQSRERVDVALKPELRGPDYPDAGSLEELYEFLLKWPPSTGRGQVRMAFGAVLHAKSESASATMDLLNTLLPHLHAPTDAIDVIFQLNQKSTSKILPDMTINRLLKWSTVQATFFKLDANGKALLTPASADTFALQFELDINTAKPATIDGELLEKVSSELAAIGREFVAKDVFDYARI
jgi:hypothetical protein